MNKSVRYSTINCPSCGRSFKFLDDFESRKLTGQVMKCPRCKFMFAFHVVTEDESVVAQPKLKFTADVQDKDAFDRFAQELQNASEDNESSKE